MEELLWRLIEIAQNTAPELWSIAMKQVQVQVILAMAVAVSCFILFMICVGFCYRAMKNGVAYKKDNYWDDSFAVPLTGALFTFIIALIFFVGIAVPRIMNPAYYAIKILLNLM